MLTEPTVIWRMKETVSRNIKEIFFLAVFVQGITSDRRISKTRLKFFIRKGGDGLFQKQLNVYWLRV
jgi:hypothetical protein